MKIQELKRKRDHVETKENYSWRSEECLAEVNGYDSDQIIIYSKLACNYNLRNASSEALFYYPISWYVPITCKPSHRFTILKKTYEVSFFIKESGHLTTT